MKKQTKVTEIKKSEEGEEEVMKGQKRITRREMLKLSAAVGAGSLLVACAPTVTSTVASTLVPPTVAPTAVPPTVAPTAVLPTVAPTKVLPTSAPAPAGPVTLEIFDPKGPTEVTAIYNKRLDTLDGKTIAYTEGTWMVGTARPFVLDLLKKQFPTMKVVDVPQYGEIQSMSDANLKKLITDNKIDAMIVGNAG
jgi:hypothetical protein